MDAARQWCGDLGRRSAPLRRHRMAAQGRGARGRGGLLRRTRRCRAHLRPGLPRPASGLEARWGRLRRGEAPREHRRRRIRSAPRALRRRAARVGAGRRGSGRSPVLLGRSVAARDRRLAPPRPHPRSGRRAVGRDRGHVRRAGRLGGVAGDTSALGRAGAGRRP